MPHSLPHVYVTVTSTLYLQPRHKNVQNNQIDRPFTLLGGLLYWYHSPTPFYRSNSNSLLRGSLFIPRWWEMIGSLNYCNGCIHLSDASVKQLDVLNERPPLLLSHCHVVTDPLLSECDIIFEFTPFKFWYVPVECWYDFLLFVDSCDFRQSRQNTLTGWGAREKILAVRVT